jgi:hypothetical protein
MDRRASRALTKIDKMVREIKQWKGEAPKLVRVNHGDYLALVEANLIQDGRLRGRELEVKPG